MIKDINESLNELFESKEYKELHENYPDYYLAHCFSQLDKNGNESKPLQIGFYSPEKDNLVTFTMKPTIKRGEFEEAFKDGGVIERLKHEKIITINEATKKVNELAQENYKGEVINSYIVIIQSNERKTIYNITAITLAFSMLIIKIDAKTGEILNHEKRNILDLRKDTGDEK